MTAFVRHCCIPVLLALALPLSAVAAASGASADLTTCAKPVYPPESLRKSQEGKVIIEFTIGTDGAVKQARVHTTSFFPLLDSTARDALALCRFRPAMKDGVAVEATTKVQYVWTLSGPATRAPFADAPAPLLPFFEKARAADGIVDPYQRCLAFPDYPGNKWPAGLGKQYCEITNGKRITGAEIDAMIGRHQVAELDALFRRDLARHFSTDDFSEVIHNDFWFFHNGGDESNRVSQAWLEAAPGSPFANAARGIYLLGAAQAARGGEWAADTPADNMRRMADFAVMANRFLEKAVQLEPRLMPAYSALIEVGKIDSGRKRGQSAFARGASVDPACRELTRRRMEALTPRWGGSHADMVAYAAQLEPLVGRRPLVALSLVLPAVDKADELQRDNRAGAAAPLLAQAATIAPFTELFTELGTNLYNSQGSDWDTLASLLTAYRYSDDDAIATRIRAGLLLDVAHDPAWAQASLKRAVALNPGEPFSRLQLARGQMALGDFTQAEAVFTELVAVPDMNDMAMFNLMLVAGQQNKFADLDRHATAYTKAYPASPDGWFFKGMAKARLGRQADAVAAFKTFLPLVPADKKAFLSANVAAARRYIAGKRDPGMTGKHQPKPTP